jgi:hypothetical protein
VNSELPTLRTLSALMLKLPADQFSKLVRRLATVNQKANGEQACPHLTFVNVGRGGPPVTLHYDGVLRTYNGGETFCWTCGDVLRSAEIPPMSAPATGPRESDDS